MVIGHTIDENGFYTGDVLEDSDITPDVLIRCPNGLYKPKWNGIAWIEGLTQQEIDDLNNVPVEPSIEDRLQATEDALTALLGI